MKSWILTLLLTVLINSVAPAKSFSGIPCDSGSMSDTTQDLAEDTDPEADDLQATYPFGFNPTTDSRSFLSPQETRIPSEPFLENPLRPPEI